MLVGIFLLKGELRNLLEQIFDVGRRKSQGVSCIISVIRYLLLVLREVFSRAEYGMLKKQYSPGCHKHGYVGPVERGVVVYIMGAL
jgi:hypothetical protein